jgi:hypothetical protein
MKVMNQRAQRTTARPALAGGGAAVAMTAMLAMTAAAGCVKDTGLLVILQNQQPTIDTTTAVPMCSAGDTPSAVAVGSGVLDLSVPAALENGYLAYPLVQNQLPSRADTPGGTDPNTVRLQGVNVTLIPPPGVTVDWPDGCGASFFAPGASALIPGASQGMTSLVVGNCQAKVIHDLFASSALPPDLSQQVLFDVEMNALGTLTSGDQVLSDTFSFSVRMCYGCLQTGFPDVAQFDWPARPACSAAPKPNLYHGNPCNIAQDFGPLLCCTGEGNVATCPAPDM